uniref:DUF2971 domain-containing protein n=1 Tax=Dialister sp. TaxID=1955814 RepID=UPI0040270DC7
MNPYENWNISDTDQKLYSIFMPQYVERVLKFAENNQKLVHYTSAATALSILKNKEIWMRNTRCMNDFSEVRYGIELFTRFCQKPEKYDLLKKAWGKKAGVFEEAFFSAVEAFDEWSNSTYICCFSEQEAEEDQLGRLSMWRGYGTDCGVAMVLRLNSFLPQNNDFQIYTTPVEYLTEKGFDDYLIEFGQRIEAEKSFIEALTDRVIEEWTANMIKAAVVSIKHPGFKEEREWRVIADLNSCQGLKLDTIAVNGIPQLVMKLPLTAEMENNRKGFSIPANLDHLIIGPTSHPAIIAKALAEELAKCGVTDLSKKITVSGIPYRAHV